MLLGITPDILIYFIHNERTKENKEKRERERKGKEKEIEIRSEVHVPQTSLQDYYTPLSRSSPPPRRTRIHTRRQESTQHKQVEFSGTKQHSAIAHSPRSGRRRAGKEETDEEESEKERSHERKKAL